MEKKDKVFLIGDKPKDIPNNPDIEWIPKGNRYYTGTIHRIDVPATLAPVFPFDPWKPPVEQLKAYKPIKFKDYYFWCKDNFPFIENQFDATTTYEMFCELYKYFRQVVIDLGIVQDNVDILGENYVELYKAFLQLEDIFNDLKDYLIQNIEEFQEYMITQFNSFTQDITNKFEQFKTDLTNEWNTYKLNLNNEWAAFQQKINQDISNLQQEWTTYQTNLNKEWSDFKSYVENYLDNLDIQQFVDNRIQQLIDQGYFNELVQNFVNLEWDKIKQTLPNYFNLLSVGIKDDYSQDVIENKNSDIFLPRGHDFFIDFNAAHQANFVGDGIIDVYHSNKDAIPKDFHRFPLVDNKVAWDKDMRWYNDINVQPIHFSTSQSGDLFLDGIKFNNFANYKLIGHVYMYLNPNFHLNEEEDPITGTHHIGVSTIKFIYEDTQTGQVCKLPEKSFNECVIYGNATTAGSGSFFIKKQQTLQYKNGTAYFPIDLSTIENGDLIDFKINHIFSLDGFLPFFNYQLIKWFSCTVNGYCDLGQVSPYLVFQGFFEVFDPATNQVITKIGYTRNKYMNNIVGSALHFSTFIPDSQRYNSFLEAINNINKKSTDFHYEKILDKDSPSENLDVISVLDIGYTPKILYLTIFNQTQPILMPFGDSTITVYFEAYRINMSFTAIIEVENDLIHIMIEHDWVIDPVPDIYTKVDFSSEELILN